MSQGLVAPGLVLLLLSGSGLTAECGGAGTEAGSGLRRGQRHPPPMTATPASNETETDRSLNRTEATNHETTEATDPTRSPRRPTDWQVARDLHWFRRVRITVGGMPEQQQRPPGRPRKWATEADRKRAYRARRATELAEPHSLRTEAQQARAAATRAEAEAATAARAAQRAEQRAATAERRAAKLLEQLQTCQTATRRARLARDEAQRLLKRKLAWAKNAAQLRDDPDALLAIVAEQRALLDWYRRMPSKPS